MLELITGQFGAAIGGVIALIVGAFGIAFKMRGSAIEKQKEIITNQEVDKVVLESAINTQKETVKKTEKANEILSERVDVDDAAARLRERAAARNSGGKG